MSVETILDSGLLAYWLGSDLDAGDGNTISAWTDRENGRDMAQATAAKRPTQDDDYSSTGFRAAVFDGTDDFLSVTHSSLDVTTYGLLLAVKQNTAATADTVYQVGSASYCRMTSNSGTVGDFRMQNAGVSTSGASSGSTGINVIAARCQSNKYFQIFNGSGIGFYNAASLTINKSGTHYMGSRGGTLQFLDGGIFAAAVIDLSVCSWIDVLAAQIQMRKDFGLTTYDNLPASGGAGGAANLINGGLVR